MDCRCPCEGINTVNHSEHRRTATEAVHNLRAPPGWGHQLQPKCQIQCELIWGFATKQDGLQEPKARKPKARISRMPWYEQQYYLTEQTLVLLVYFLLPLSFGYFLLFFHTQKWRAFWYLLCNPVPMFPSLGANDRTGFPPTVCQKKIRRILSAVHYTAILFPPVNSDFCC